MFKKRNERKRAQQTFDREKITVKINGKDVNVYDMIQNSREDTEIYEVLEKYGCIDKIKRNDEAMYLDVVEMQTMKDLRGVNEQRKAAEELFLNLPIEVRKEFDNNINTFTKKAPEWLKNYRKSKEKSKEQTEEPELPLNNGDKNE